MVIGKIILIRYFFYRSVSYSLNFFMIIFNAAHFLQILLVSVKKVRLSLSFLCRIQVVQAWNRLTASIFQSPTCNSNRFDRINNCAHCAVIYIYIYLYVQQAICIVGCSYQQLDCPLYHACTRGTLSVGLLSMWRFYKNNLLLLTMK